MITDVREGPFTKTEIEELHWLLRSLSERSYFFCGKPITFLEVIAEVGIEGMPDVITKTLEADRWK